jgi:hypothetical protein
MKETLAETDEDAESEADGDKNRENKSSQKRYGL